LGWVNTGWVMSSGVHQNDVSCLSLSIKTVKVVIDLGLSCGWVVVRVLIKLETCSVNDVVVVGPSGIWDPTERWKLLVDKLKTNSQWSSPWQGLDCDNSARFNSFALLTKDKPLRMSIKTCNTFDWNVFLSLLKILPYSKLGR
jgi:hypothetical protein